jgi:hypothetical protein
MLKFATVGLVVALALVAVPAVTDVVSPEAQARHMCDDSLPVPCCHIVDCVPLLRRVVAEGWLA